MFWLYAGFAAGLFCIVRGAVDLRQRRYIWGLLGIVIGLTFLLAPIQTYAVKYDLSGTSRLPVPPRP
jgi:hypothetical protein